MKICILGSSSYIAQSIYPMLLERGYEVDRFNHEELNILDLNKLRPKLEKNKYNFIINCAVRGGRRIIPDSTQDCYENILAQENLISCKDLYDKLIIFGSGIEFNRKTNILLRKEGDYYSPSTEYYGLSKMINSIRAQNEDKIINLRIFAVFSELEHEHRFIKTNIKKYLNKETITIFDDQLFDFFYIKDLFTLINYYIQNPPEKATEINCSYENKHRLSEVSSIINDMDSHKIPIIVEKYSGNHYCGNGQRLKNLNLSLIGLENGIKEVYEKLKYE